LHKKTKKDLKET
jgi:hypothetical protein